MISKNLPLILLWVTLFLPCSIATASSVTVAQDKINQHEKINQLVQQLSQRNLVRGNFIQEKKLQGLKYPLRAQGRFIFWQKQGLYMATEKPFFSAFTITPSALIHWQLDGTANLAQETSGLIQREINKTLLAFLSADIAEIEQKFNATWQFDQNGWRLMLSPKLAVIAKSLQKVILEGNDFVQKLIVITDNGDETHIEFTDQSVQLKPTSEECRWFYLEAQQACASFAAQG